MYARSVETFIKLLPIIAIVLVGDLALQAWKENFNTKSMFFVETLLWSYLAYAAHAEFLLPANRNKAEDSKRVIWFAMRTFGLSLLVAIPIVFAVFTFNIPANSSLGVSLGLTVILILIASITFLLIFSLLGTMLPAYVADRGRGLGAALSRGISQFPWTASRLIGGPGIVGAIGVLTVVVAMNYIGAGDKLLGLDTYSTIVNIFGSLILNSVLALSTIMTAWVLSTAFKRSFNEVL